jgi:uncharacterized membrane protein YbaN (DUF454 family)
MTIFFIGNSSFVHLYDWFRTIFNPLYYTFPEYLLVSLFVNTRFLWNIGGTLFLALGLIGIPLPVLPTTPFLLLAAACYLRGSKRMYRWMHTNRWFGDYLSDYRAGKGVPRKTKVYSIATLWVVIGISMYAVRENIPVIAVLAVVALGVSVHILLIKTKAE